MEEIAKVDETVKVKVIEGSPSNQVIRTPVFRIKQVIVKQARVRVVRGLATSTNCCQKKIPGKRLVELLSSPK